MSMKDARNFFWVAKKHRDLYLGIVSSAQINSTISAIYCLCGIFWGMLEK